MAEGGSFAVVLHDVAPATWPACAGFVAELDRRYGIPLTFLVVPDYHRQGRLDRFPAFLSLLERRLARGDELVLHGYHHDDPGPLPCSPRAWVRRRVMTHEGEFAALPGAVVRERLDRGLELFHRLGWPVHGFVPPAWMLGEQARSVLAEYPFRYTSGPSALMRLPGFSPLQAPSLVWSARSAWRRVVSLLWNRRCLVRHRRVAMIRLGIHPVDLRFPLSREFWLETVETLVSSRRATTKRAWLEGAH